MPPVVTVVMPLFNQATFVGRSLASLFAQAFTDWQLLIVDDGSTDDWREAAEKFLRDPRLEVVELGRNHGLGVALNRGWNGPIRPTSPTCPPTTSTIRGT